MEKGFGVQRMFVLITSYTFQLKSFSCTVFEEDGLPVPSNLLVFNSGQELSFYN